MTYRITGLFVFLLIASCNFGGEDEPVHIPDRVDSVITDDAHTDSIPEENRAIWTYSFDEQLRDFKPKKQRQLNQDSLSLDYLIKLINLNWKNQVVIKYNHRSGDTLFIDIPNSTMLTQQMGTQGALEFMVSTTFTLTELKGVKNIYYAFEEGDHAVPGVYNRHSWDVIQ